MTDPMRAQALGNLVVNALKTCNIPGVKKVELTLGEEKGVLLVRVTKISIKHARHMILDYPFTFAELEQKEPATHAADIAKMIGRADEIGPSIGSEGQLLQVARAAGRVH